MAYPIASRSSTSIEHQPLTGSLIGLLSIETLVLQSIRVRGRRLMLLDYLMLKYLIL